MDYKEKYEQALDRAKDWAEGKALPAEATTEDILYYFFPELKEKNDDERIRKALINKIKCLDEEESIEGYSFYAGNYTADDCIAWLERQGEKQDYNPYKVTIESIATMVEKYANGDLKDFYDNIKVKCKDAMEYDNIWNKKQGDKEEPQVYETGNGEVITYSGSEGYKVDEEDDDFIIYHPLKNGKGEYECISYSFYGSLTSFSEDKDLIDFLRTCFYTEEECNEWIEQQKEQKQGEQKSDWSEEETKDLVHILKVLDDCYIYGKHDLSKTDYDNLTSTLKSLKGKCKGAVEHDKIEPKFKV